MPEPILLGYPVTLLILFFFFYSFLGWVMETCYCSFLEKKYVSRGFLYGPICPIYGVGALLMILFFKPLTGNIVVFYITAVVVMSAWEYVVGWFLETTTHIKYWDYSHFKINLHGRICLPISLVWGVLSYVIIFWVHPQTEALFAQLAPWISYVLCGITIGVLISDATLTIHQLALVSKLTKNVAKMGEQLQLQFSLGKAELGDKLDETADALHAKYNEQLQRLERNTRRFRKRYRHMTSGVKYHINTDDLKAVGERALEEIQRTNAARRAEKEAKKKAKKAARGAKNT